MNARVVKPAAGGLALDDELDLETRQQNFVEHPNDEFVLTDSQTAHFGGIIRGLQGRGQRAKVEVRG